VTLADGQAHQTRQWKTPAAPRKDPRTVEKMEDGNSEQRKFPGKEDAVGHPVVRTQVSNHASFVHPERSIRMQRCGVLRALTDP